MRSLRRPRSSIRWSSRTGSIPTTSSASISRALGPRATWSRRSLRVATCWRTCRSLSPSSVRDSPCRSPRRVRRCTPSRSWPPVRRLDEDHRPLAQTGPARAEVRLRRGPAPAGVSGVGGREVRSGESVPGRQRRRLSPADGQRAAAGHAAGPQPGGQVAAVPAPDHQAGRGETRHCPGDAADHPAAVREEEPGQAGLSPAAWDAFGRRRRRSCSGSTQQGTGVRQLMERFDRSRATVHRIINQRRALALLARKIEYVPSDEFLQAGAREQILAKPFTPVTAPTNHVLSEANGSLVGAVPNETSVPQAYGQTSHRQAQGIVCPCHPWNWSGRTCCRSTSRS